MTSGVFFHLAVLLALGGVATCQTTKRVDTTLGWVVGHLLEDVYNGEFSADVYSYLGVTFGVANRFEKPEFPPRSPDDFIADKLGQSCPQNAGGLFMMTHCDWDNFGEDCLNVNIYAPADEGAGPYPVWVWWHGGAYVGGSNIQYPGQFMATRGVIVVVVNYRLNDFGFAYTASDACVGNFGMWDQVLSLQYIQDNIANFGGDPGRVVISGQSAGAGSTGLHLMSPESQGLFHAAILQSGTERNFWSINWPESHPENYIWGVADNLGCGQEPTDQDMIDCLKTKNWQEIVDANFQCTPGHFCQGMAPVVDGPNGFLPMVPQDMRASGDFSKVPIMTGINKDDASFYTLTYIPESIVGGFTRQEFHCLLADRFLSFWIPLYDNKTMMDLFLAIDYNYAYWPYIDNEYENREAFNKISTDTAFGMPWDRQMKVHSEVADVFGYLYDYRSRNATQLFPEWMGVPHMGELPQVWGYPFLKYNPHVQDDSGIYFDIISYTQEDFDQAIFWNKIYANFIHTYDPTPTPVTDPYGFEQTWRPFTQEDTAYFYVANNSGSEITEVRTNFRQEDYAFWREYMAYIWREDPVPLAMSAQDTPNVLAVEYCSNLTWPLNNEVGKMIDWDDILIRPLPCSNRTWPPEIPFPTNPAPLDDSQEKSPKV